MAVLLLLGHNWSKNETWFLTNKQQHSLETKIRKTMNFHRKDYPN